MTHRAHTTHPGFSGRPTLARWRVLNSETGKSKDIFGLFDICT